MTIALLLVPNQYENKGDFLAVANDLKANFCSNSVIFGVTWDGKDTNTPTASPIGKVSAPFSNSFWQSCAAADTFISLCHCGINDGPMIGPKGEQPWPTDHSNTALTDPGVQFWQRVGWGIGRGGRVLLAGCDTAHSYGKAVAKVMQPTVFGFAQHIGAGVVTEMRLYIGNYFLKNRVGSNVVKC